MCAKNPTRCQDRHLARTCAERSAASGPETSCTVKSREHQVQLCKYSGLVDCVFFPPGVAQLSPEEAEGGRWLVDEPGWESFQFPQNTLFFFLFSHLVIFLQKMDWLMLGSRLSRFTNIWVTFLNAANRCWWSAVEGASFQSLQSVSLLLANGRTHKPSIRCSVPRFTPSDWEQAAGWEMLEWNHTQVWVSGKFKCLQEWERRNVATPTNLYVCRQRANVPAKHQKRGDVVMFW